MALEQRVKEELELNPALEEDDNSAEGEEDFTNEDSSITDVDNETDAENFDAEEREEEVGLQNDDISYEDYVDEDEFSDFKYQINNSGKDNDLKETPIRELNDFHDLLEEQLGLLDVHEDKYTIGLFLIGCIDDDDMDRDSVDVSVNVYDYYCYCYSLLLPAVLFMLMLMLQYY